MGGSILEWTLPTTLKEYIPDATYIHTSLDPTFAGPAYNYNSLDQLPNHPLKYFIIVVDLQFQSVRGN